MNAIVGFCHFCEAHGPRPVFCTFTTGDEAHTTEAAANTTDCNGCKSLGPETVLVSKDDDGTVYCSRESVASAEATAFLRQAAIRSITCEVSWDKEGGVVFFNDIHGYVLSQTFQLHDTRSRGLQRWFSIVVLMKDEPMLLSMSLQLSEHMQQISSHLRALAAAVYAAEQRECSQRALRLTTGCNYFGQSRSLLQLTGKEDIFYVLHVQFTRMLKAGALNYTEKLHTSKELLQKLCPHGQAGLTIFSKDTCTTDPDCMSVKDLQSVLGQDVFRVVLYCTLVGINIELNCKATPAREIVKSLLSLLPKCDPERVSYIRVGGGQADGGQAGSGQAGGRQAGGRRAGDRRAAAPETCLVTETENNNFSCEWSGSLPAKCPTLMVRLEALAAGAGAGGAGAAGAGAAGAGAAGAGARVLALQLLWLGIARALHAAGAGAAGAVGAGARGLRAALGAGPHDDALLQHWMRAFCE